MTEKHKQLLEFSRALINKPYDYSHFPETMQDFLDCSSFTQDVYKKINIEIPRNSIAQATVGREVENISDIDIGDLVFFRGKKGHYNDEWFPNKNIYIGHVAIFIGNDSVIHASGKNGKVAEENLDQVINYEGPIVIIKRIL